MKSFLLILTLNFLCNRIAAQDRKCDCRLQYEVSNNMALYKPLEKLFTTRDAADKRDICDFRCTEWCAKEIRKEINLNDNSNVITDLGKPSILFCT